MRVKRFRMSLVACAVFALASCKSTSEPVKTFNLCVHVTGAAFVPGSTGADCAVPQLIRAGQARTVELEADLYSGDPRPATVALEFFPNGWTVSLGGSTIAVPGLQTLTLEVPEDAVPTNYQIAVRATSGGEVVILTFTIAVSAPI